MLASMMKTLDQAAIAICMALAVTPVLALAAFGSIH
jgi:hypothetical protein